MTRPTMDVEEDGYHKRFLRGVATLNNATRENDIKH